MISPFDYVQIQAISFCKLHRITRPNHIILIALNNQTWYLEMQFLSRKTMRTKILMKGSVEPKRTVKPIVNRFPTIQCGDLLICKEKAVGVGHAQSRRTKYKSGKSRWVAHEIVHSNKAAEARGK